LELRVIPQQGETRRRHDNKVIKKGLTRLRVPVLKGRFSLRMNESQRNRKPRLSQIPAMKKKSASQSAFSNLPLLTGLFLVLIGVFLALLGFAHSPRKRSRGITQPRDLSISRPSRI
jgi:hypothetical protein